MTQHPDRPRIAMFSPVLPVPSGISVYTERWLELMSGSIKAELFIDDYQPKESLSVAAHPANTFEERHDREPYDLVIYQLGNAPCHEYMYDYLYRYPGLLVLHDAWLMASRMHSYLHAWRGEEFRAEMKAAYPERGEAAAEIILSGMHNWRFLRHFPMIELPMRASRLTVVHEPWLAERLSRRMPDCRVEAAPQPILHPDIDADARERVRRKLGLSPNDFLVGTFGLLTPDKGIPQLLAAFSALRRDVPEARLLLAGDAGEDLPLETLLAESNHADDVIHTGRLEDKPFFEHMTACDAIVQLRWPTRRETSAALLAAMHLALPVITTDLAHLRDYPEDGLLRISVRDDNSALLRHLLALAQVPEMRRKIGNTARAWTEKKCGDAVIIDSWKTCLLQALDV